MLTCAIETKEGRHVTVTDIPGYCFHPNINEYVHMMLEGEIAELIMNLEPKLYSKYVWRNKYGKSILYVQLKKTLYGMLQAALLFWQLLSKTLIE